MHHLRSSPGRRVWRVFHRVSSGDIYVGLEVVVDQKDLGYVRAVADFWVSLMPDMGRISVIVFVVAGWSYCQAGELGSTRATGEDGQGASSAAMDLAIDAYLVKFQLRVEQGNVVDALATFEAVRESDSSAIPVELWYTHAKLCKEQGMFEIARQSIETYIQAAGREGEHYRDAIRLSILIQDEIDRSDRERRVAERQRELEFEQHRRLWAKAQEQIDAARELPRDQMKIGDYGPAMIQLRGGRVCFGPVLGADQCTMVDIPRFAISKHLITVREFRRFARSKRYRSDAERSKHECYLYTGGWDPRATDFDRDNKRTWKTEARSERHPVVCVSVNDANRYVEWLSDQTGSAYRLPSAAELDYAFLAGTQIGSLERYHPDRLESYGYGGWDAPQARKLLGERHVEPPTYWRCSLKQEMEEKSRPGAIGTCEANPVGIVFENGAVSEMAHSCMVLHTDAETPMVGRWVYRDAIGLHQPLDGCDGLPTRRYGGWALTYALRLGAKDRRADANGRVGFRVVKME